ncbi:MAG: hypothetical protein J0I79_08675 [Mesorhizobium sp.]|uniref:hypothetical protein n=1 Tax=Mesorhizobium sp. TaxID=1871066 RepID=UPI001ACB6925|nr:hypothetical protein [Mesorhizobium sp.]MBN9218015.1 hypothetical protein [Mesorhizobium sp.]
MSFFHRMSRRTLVRAMIALPALSLARKLPDANATDTGLPQADPNEIVEVNGWILKRSDLA